MASNHLTLSGIYATYVLRDRRVKTTIDGVKDRTFVDVTLYDTTNYRDKLQAGELGRAMNNSTSFDANSCAENEDDAYLHVAPRFEGKKRTEIRFWAGKAQTIACTTTNASANVTTGTTDYLSPGQVVSGTGITAGSTIISITNSTTFVISAVATTSATNNLTFDGGVLLAAVWADEYRMISPATYTQI